MSVDHSAAEQEVDDRAAASSGPGIVPENLPSVDFAKHLNIVKAGYMLNCIVRDPTFGWNIMLDDWNAWKVIFADENRRAMPIGARRNLGSQLRKHWKRTYPDTAPVEMADMVCKIKDAIDQLKEEADGECREDGEEGKDVFDDWEVYPKLAIICWALKKDPDDIHAFERVNCEQWEIDVFRRTVPFIEPRRIRSKLYKTGWRMREELDVLIEQTAKDGKTIKDIVHLHFNATVTRELLAYHAKP